MSYKDLDLQLFADGGAGGADGGDGGSPATGDTPAVAAQGSYEDRLRELGVPEQKIRKKKTQPEAQAVAAPPAEEPEAEDSQPVTDTTTEEPKRMTWDEIMADPEYNRQMQSVVQNRLKDAKAAQEKLDKFAPALELLGRRYNLDPNNMDFEALTKAINDDDSYYEQKAQEMGINVETAKRIDQIERENNRRREIDERSAQQQIVIDHLRGLEAQGEELKKTFPNFDLRAELQNPVFARMTAPGGGISVADAYYAVHRNEIQAAAMQVTAQKTAQKLSNSIQSGMRRPAEAGTSAQAPSVTSFDYKHASREQREALKREIRAAAARGEKLYPGM